MWPYLKWVQTIGDEQRVCTTAMNWCGLVRMGAKSGQLSLAHREIYAGVKISSLPVFVRLDGWRFHRIARKLRLAQPYDEKFVRCLVDSSRPIVQLFNARLCYTFSDEVNFLFFGRPGFVRVEKIDSIFAGLVSSAFAQLVRPESLLPIAFDCRCIPLAREEVIPYLIWRQAEAWRNCHNAWAHHLLTQAGLAPKEAAQRLHGLAIGQLRRLLRELGKPPDKIPAWQMGGVLIYREAYTKKGWDPIKRREVIVTRHRLAENWALPVFNSKEGKKFLERILG